METLPPEMVEKVSKHLTSRDLARCCAVSPKWREIFDQDCLWKPHCDAELEEPLRTTPSVVKPVFVSPEEENSTLTTISKWRLAFLRERHLWGNWMKKNCETHYFESDTILMKSFLSNNFLIIWTERVIQIWDVSVVPASLVAEIDSPVNFEECLKCSVLNSNMLLVEYYSCIQVFLLDIINKSIKLKHEFPLDGKGRFHSPSVLALTSVDRSVILGISVSDFNFEILDLEKGMKIREVPCPVMEDDATIYEINISPTNDDVLVSVSRPESYTLDHYIYSLEQELFLPGPIASTSLTSDIAINKHYVAFGGLPSMRILDYHTSEVVFENEDQERDLYPEAFKDSFIFLEWKSKQCWLKLFSLSNKTISTVLEFSPSDIFSPLKVVYNKFVGVLGPDIKIKSEGSEDSWRKNLNLIKFEDSETEKSPSLFILPIRFLFCCINKACTRGFSSCTDTTIIYFW